MMMKKTTLSVMVAACFVSTGAMAEEGKLLAPVVVTATRVEQDSFDLPMSIDKVEKKDIQDGQPRITLSESLIRIPGITAQNRYQYSSDPQISSRGFGARSSFGVRGIRLYVDGIPLTMPDGTGTPGNVDLGSIAGIEVMRGPFSAMYGNSSGGVIQVFTDTPPATPEIGVDYYAGSFGTQRTEVRAAGTKANVDYMISTSELSSDGFRKQSASEKQQATIRLGVKLADDTKLTTLINWIDQYAQDPGGLKRTGTSTNPGAFSGVIDWTGANKGAVDSNARSYKGNTQIGFNLEKTIDTNNTLNLITYAGQRTSDGYIAAPAGGSFTTGRLSQIARDFYGVDLRMTNKGQWLSKPYVLTYGVNAGFMEDARKDFGTNYVGGVSTITSTNRNETQKASNFDQYAQGTYSFAERWDLHAGVRHSSIKMNINDPLNSNNGKMDYDKTIPVAGILFKALPTLNFYANVGKGFEAPTLIESTYSSTTSANGTNTSLKPSTSTNIELGSKWIVSDRTRVNFAVFDISTKDEIVISGAGTYTVYGNAGNTSRTGAEISAEHLLPRNVSLYAAYTLLDAKYGAGTSINSADVSGKKLPGTYKSQIYAEAAWRYQPAGFSAAIEGRYNSKVYVNDINNDAAPSYVIVNLRGSFQQTAGQWRVTEYARIENLLNERYISSVKVNDSQSRFFESAPGRNYIVGVKANYAF